MNTKGMHFLVLFFLACGAVQGGSVLDIFPDTGLKPKAGKTACSFEYKPCGSTWTEGVSEEKVFLASIKGDGWTLGVGKGGQIYSLRGPFGESVPPQRVQSPWNDEVWQTVVTNEELIGPLQNYQNALRKECSQEEWVKLWNSTFPLMYFVHQAGIYTKGAGTDGGAAPAPFYSPCLRKRWNPETRTLELVNWMQQARTPCVWKSGVLIYTAYRDLGDGILEVNQVLYNFGTEKLTFLNTPWGGIRHSSMPHGIISNPDGSWDKAGGMYGWTDIPTRTLIDTGGWMAWAQDLEKEDAPALALVFGTDQNNVANGKRHDEAIRWGKAGTETRDYQVTERMSHAPVVPGDSWSIRWYLVAGRFSHVRKHAASLADKAGVSLLKFDADVKQPVWIKDGKVATEGKGAPLMELCAFPIKGTVPVFLLEDKRSGKQIITTDLYALAESEPFPNPLPESYVDRGIYDDRVIYRQYAPHIGYRNLLGYAFVDKPQQMKAKLMAVPASEKLLLRAEATKLWVPTGK